jgi:hypothetical protein
MKRVTKRKRSRTAAIEEESADLELEVPKRKGRPKKTAAEEEAMFALDEIVPYAEPRVTEAKIVPLPEIPVLMQSNTVLMDLWESLVLFPCFSTASNEEARKLLQKACAELQYRAGTLGPRSVAVEDFIRRLALEVVSVTLTRKPNATGLPAFTNQKHTEYIYRAMLLLLSREEPADWISNWTVEDQDRCFSVVLLELGRLLR